MRNYEVHAIAGLPDAAFRAVVESGELSKADVAAAHAMRAGRVVKKHRVGEEVDIRKRGEVEVESPVEKIARSERYGAALTDAIEGYMKAHPGCSRSAAADAVILHPATSKYVRLEKQMREVERDIRMDKLQGSWTNTNEASRQSPAMAPLVVRPSDDVQTHEAAELLQQINSGEIPFTDPRVTALVRAEKARKFGAGY
jgi:hypothetical protein